MHILWKTSACRTALHVERHGDIEAADRRVVEAPLGLWHMEWVPSQEQEVSDVVDVVCIEGSIHDHCRLKVIDLLLAQSVEDDGAQICLRAAQGLIRGPVCLAQELVAGLPSALGIGALAGLRKSNKCTVAENRNSGKKPERSPRMEIYGSCTYVEEETM